MIQSCIMNEPHRISTVLMCVCAVGGTRGGCCLLSKQRVYETYFGKLVLGACVLYRRPGSLAKETEGKLPGADVVMGEDGPGGAEGDSSPRGTSAAPPLLIGEWGGRSMF